MKTGVYGRQVQKWLIQVKKRRQSVFRWLGSQIPVNWEKELEESIPVTFRNAGGPLDERGGLRYGVTYTALPFENVGQKTAQNKSLAVDQVFFKLK